MGLPTEFKDTDSDAVLEGDNQFKEKPDTKVETSVCGGENDHMKEELRHADLTSNVMCESGEKNSEKTPSFYQNENQKESASSVNDDNTKSKYNLGDQRIALKIGFIGLERMGSLIAKQILKAHIKVYIWDTKLDKFEELKEAGAIVQENPSEVVRAADITFSFMKNQDASMAILFGLNGVIEGFQSNVTNESKGYVETTTLSDQACKDIENLIMASGGQFSVTRILGDSLDAEKASLIIIGSGSRQIMEKCSPLYRLFGKKAVNLGTEIEQASKVACISDAFLAVILVAVSECMALAAKSGLNLKILTKILEATPLSSPFLMKIWEAGLNENFEPVRPLDDFQKNVKMALDLADSHDQETRFIAMTNEVLKFTLRLGGGDKDISSVFSAARNPRY